MGNKTMRAAPTRRSKFLLWVCLESVLLAALLLPPCSVEKARAGGVVGTGTPASCTEAALDAALAAGGLVSFNCGAQHQ